MKNLNAKQIKKALGRCKSPKLTKCDGCPREKEDGHCMYRLNEDALALITSQEQRIKELEAETKRLESLCVSKDIIIGDLSKENERLRAENESLAISGFKDCEISQTRIYRVRDKHPAVMAVIADTVRKMQERLKRECFVDSGWEVLQIGTIDQIATEMLEDGEERTCRQ